MRPREHEAFLRSEVADERVQILDEACISADEAEAWFSARRAQLLTKAGSLGTLESLGSLVRGKTALTSLITLVMTTHSHPSGL